MPHYSFRAKNEAVVLQLRRELPDAVLTLHRPHSQLEVIIDADIALHELRLIMMAIPDSFLMVETLRRQAEVNREIVTVLAESFSTN